LINYGADINKTDCNGNTPLHTAASKGNFEVVKFLVEAGANPIAKNSKGKTPLDLANEGSYPATVEFLASIH
jgi:ankyrin repeat protein